MSHGLQVRIEANIAAHQAEQKQALLSAEDRQHHEQ